MSAIAGPMRSSCEQELSPFAAILGVLTDTCPFVRAACVFDSEGETVDYIGEGDPDELRITAATWQLALVGLQGVDGLRRIHVRTPREGVVLVALPDGYGLLVTTRPMAATALSARLLSAVVGEVLDEAGLRFHDDTLSDVRPKAWSRLEVACGDDGRPVRARSIGTTRAPGAWHPLEVLGTIVGMPRRERGYRVRLDGSVEKTIVCERARTWFVDGVLDD